LGLLFTAAPQWDFAGWQWHWVLLNIKEQHGNVFTWMAFNGQWPNTANRLVLLYSVLQAPFDGLSNIFMEVKSNLKELTASIQTHNSNRSYARMQSKDEMFAIVEEDEQGASGAQAPFSGSFDGSSNQSTHDAR
jgi:hypothetical protein